MLQYAVFVGLLALAAAAPQNPKDAETTILRSESEAKDDGSFSWVSELSDGTKSEQSGFLKEGPDAENPILTLKGSYSYTSPEGELISITYTADENGFVPQGAHLPTPPPIPEAIQKALDIILRNAEQQTAASNRAAAYQLPRSQ